MKAVMPSVPEHVLEWRKRTGADRYDEMWKGVLHMPPAPSVDHEDFLFGLEAYLRFRWAKSRRARVARMNVSPPGGWPTDYRIPDLIVWDLKHEDRNLRTHFEGPPDLVVEIVSPDDESREKLGFYAELGVPEVWIIDGETKSPEIHLLRDGGYGIQAPDPEGWATSPFTGIELRPSGGGRLTVRIGKDESTREELPLD